mmetsp:Transcript_16817/g.65716  ORF Transcript_16817/g.65716 Transcript_16817/m.65716 type:complete len:350 (-) Transcript_16817:63-1112(-)
MPCGDYMAKEVLENVDNVANTGAHLVDERGRRLVRTERVQSAEDGADENAERVALVPDVLLHLVLNELRSASLSRGLDDVLVDRTEFLRLRLLFDERDHLVDVLLDEICSNHTVAVQPLQHLHENAEEGHHCLLQRGLLLRLDHRAARVLDEVQRCFRELLRCHAHLSVTDGVRHPREVCAAPGMDHLLQLAADVRARGRLGALALEPLQLLRQVLEVLRLVRLCLHDPEVLELDELLEKQLDHCLCVRSIQSPLLRADPLRCQRLAPAEPWQHQTGGAGAADGGGEGMLRPRLGEGCGRGRLLLGRGSRGGKEGLKSAADLIKVVAEVLSGSGGLSSSRAAVERHRRR